jgi:hypothetical protein
VTNTNSVYTLIKKDFKNQKEEVKMLLTFGKEKLEEEIQLNEEDKEFKMNIINYLMKMRK